MLRVKYIGDAGPFSEVGITGKQQSWSKNNAAFVPDNDAVLLLASGRFVVASVDILDRSEVSNFESMLQAAGWPKRFPGFRPMLLASLVAGATATRVGLTVTITATAHGIPATTYDGFRFFIPPTTSIPSGAWAASVVRTDANTLTCTLPIGTAGADFAGESINSGAAYTTQTELCVMTVSANTLRPGEKVSAAFMRGGDTTATTKTLRMQFAGSNVCGLTAGSTPFMDGKIGFRVLDNAQRISVSGVAEGAAVAAIVYAAIDTTIDNSLQLLGTLSAGAAFLALFDAHVEIVSQ